MCEKLVIIFYSLLKKEGIMKGERSSKTSFQTVFYSLNIIHHKNCILVENNKERVKIINTGVKELTK